MAVEHPASKIDIPFALSEPPRIFLQWLAIGSILPDDIKQRIATWLEHYNRHLVEYVREEYGKNMLGPMDHLSEMLGQMFLAEVAEGREAADKEMFEKLEDEIFGGGDGPG